MLNALLRSPLAMDDSVIPNTAQHYVECDTYACRQYSKFYCKTCHQRRCEQCTLEHLNDPRKENHEVVLYQDRLRFLTDDSQFNTISHQVNRSLDESGVPDTAQHYIECDTYGCTRYSRFYCRTCYQRVCEQCKLKHMKDPLKSNHDIVMYQDRLSFLPDDKSQLRLFSEKVNRMNTMSRVSEVMYVEMCRKIGTQTEVTVRRDVLDLAEMINEAQGEYQASCSRNVRTGGSRDGFQKTLSDKMDFMCPQYNHYVICDFSQVQAYHPPRDTLIYMDTSLNQPGFARLELLTESRSVFVISSLLNMNNVVYISSSLFKSAFFRFQLSYKSYLNFESMTIQGPGFVISSQSGNDVYRVECLHSRHWPSAASLWVDRSLAHKWPSRGVLQSILNEGFYLVPIGSKQSKDFDELEHVEWRLSFSISEQILVHSMNHVQFLCYGLLKILLKEIICNELLCSYFMKTVLFWRIQNDPSNLWTPSSLLQNFWNCYKYLIHSVYTGNLPNFFIPENNMFATMAIGQKRLALFQKLEHFYNMGVACLLHSSSLREILNSAICDPFLTVQTEENQIKSETEIDIACFKEIYSDSNFRVKEFRANMAKLNKINMLLVSKGCRNFILQKFMADVLISTAMSVKLECSSGTNRKRYHNSGRTIIHLFDLASKIGYISDILYLALYLYDKGRYRLALSVTELAKQRLTQGHVMYNGNVDQKMYSDVVCGKSPSTKLRKHWARDVTINVEFPYIDELKLEQKISWMNRIEIIKLPPLVTSHMLCVLCHFRQGNRPKYQESLADLRTLLICDKGLYVPLELRDISWQILGICQNVVGEFERALQSYIKSTEQIQRHKIKKASEIRIDEVYKQLGL